jgi:hypothetical protein
MNRKLFEEVLRQHFGLDYITDPEVLQSAIQAKLAAMNEVDRTLTLADVVTRVRELENMQPGDKYAPPTWTLVAACVFSLIVAAGGTFVIVRTDAWLIVKIVAGLLGLWFLVLACFMSARVVYRFANGRDWHPTPRR